MPQRTPRLRQALCLLALTAAVPASAQQTVFLDFSQSGISGFDFSQADRDTIQAAVANDFGAFNFTFTQTAPTSGDFSTIRFNTGSTISSVSKVDFRNTDRNDVGLVQTSPEFDSFAALDEFDFPNLLLQQQNFLQFTANITSRTVGQLVGLETFDALGPIGSGISPNPGFLADPSSIIAPPLPANPPSQYDIGFSGPQNATETANHLSSSTVGFVLVPVLDPFTGEPIVDPETQIPFLEGVNTFEVDQRALVPSNPLVADSPVNAVIDQYFGPREAVKLAFNEQGTVVPELPLASKQTVQRDLGVIQIPVPVQALQPSTLIVPTTATSGPLSRQIVTSEAIAVTGALTPQDGSGLNDFYSFTASAGDVINIEVKSDLLDRFDDEVDPVVSVLDSNFEPIDYFGEDAINDNELVQAAFFGAGEVDSFNSRLLDLIIPADGEYFIQVTSQDVNNTFDVGQYELFFHNSSAVEAPVGDFNVDGVVDARDYTIWRDTFDDSVVPFSGADTDGNGKIDVNDFDDWLANFGVTVGFPTTGNPLVAPATVVAAIPEPTAAFLAVLAGLTGIAGRRR